VVKDTAVLLVTTVIGADVVVIAGDGESTNACPRGTGLAIRAGITIVAR
jgi:hypothetical protein